MHRLGTINKDTLSSQFFRDQCCLIILLCANSLFWFQFCGITVYSEYSSLCSDLFLIIFVCWSHFCVLTVFTDHSCLHSDFLITFMSSQICVLITCLTQYYLTTFMIAAQNWLITLSSKPSVYCQVISCVLTVFSGNICVCIVLSAYKWEDVQIVVYSRIP